MDIIVLVSLEAKRLLGASLGYLVLYSLETKKIKRVGIEEEEEGKIFIYLGTYTSLDRLYLYIYTYTSSYLPWLLIVDCTYLPTYLPTSRRYLTLPSLPFPICPYMYLRLPQNQDAELEGKGREGKGNNLT